MTAKVGPQRGELSALLRVSRDRLLLALWVFCYRSLLAVFEILRKIEGRQNSARRPRPVGSNGGVRAPYDDDAEL